MGMEKGMLYHSLMELIRKNLMRDKGKSEVNCKEENWIRDENTKKKDNDEMENVKHKKDL
jgi:hypothetical protein